MEYTVKTPKEQPENQQRGGDIPVMKSQNNAEKHGVEIASETMESLRNTETPDHRMPQTSTKAPVKTHRIRLNTHSIDNITVSFAYVYWPAFRGVRSPKIESKHAHHQNMVGPVLMPETVVEI